MKRLCIYVVGCAMAGCTLLSPPADAPVTLSRGDSSRRQVMFTFDARESDLAATEILDMLHRYRVPAAFFVTGQFVELHPELTRRIAAEGHEVYNHSYSNPLLRHAPASKIVEQLRRADAAIVRATGQSSKPYFRPAFGEIDENLRRVAFGEGYRVVRWSVNAEDWKENLGISTKTNSVSKETSGKRDIDMTGEEKKQIADLLTKDFKPPDPYLVYATNLVEHFEPGFIVLLHVGYTNTLHILEPVIKITRNKDFTIVPLRTGAKQ